MPLQIIFRHRIKHIVYFVHSLRVCSMKSLSQNNCTWKMFITFAKMSFKNMLSIHSLQMNIRVLFSTLSRELTSLLLDTDILIICINKQCLNLNYSMYEFGYISFPEHTCHNGQDQVILRNSIWRKGLKLGSNAGKQIFFSLMDTIVLPFLPTCFISPWPQPSTPIDLFSSVDLGRWHRCWQFKGPEFRQDRITIPRTQKLNHPISPI